MPRRLSPARKRRSSLGPLGGEDATPPASTLCLSGEHSLVKLPDGDLRPVQFGAHTHKGGDTITSTPMRRLHELTSGPMASERRHKQFPTNSACCPRATGAQRRAMSRIWASPARSSGSAAECRFSGSRKCLLVHTDWRHSASHKSPPSSRNWQRTDDRRRTTDEA